MKWTHGCTWFSEAQDDYEISCSFPQEAEYHLRPLIKYRIKLLVKNNVVIYIGETQVIATACLLNRKVP